MKLNKGVIITLCILAFLGLFLFWFIGWESIRYDRNDIEIGKRVVFTEPMVHLTAIPDDMAGEYIAKKYGAILQTAERWGNLRSRFPKVHIQKEYCNKVYVVEEAFYVEQHGFLARAFTHDIQFYVMSLPNNKYAVIRSGLYEAHTINAGSTNNGCLSTTQ